MYLKKTIITTNINDNNIIAVNNIYELNNVIDLNLTCF